MGTILSKFRKNLVEERDQVAADIKANEGKTLVVNNYIVMKLTLNHVIAALDKALEER